MAQESILITFRQALKDIYIRNGLFPETTRIGHYISFVGLGKTEQINNW
jgi:hypothetical protein